MCVRHLSKLVRHFVIYFFIITLKLCNRKKGFAALRAHARCAHPSFRLIIMPIYICNCLPVRFTTDVRENPRKSQLGKNPLTMHLNFKLF
jgi:hypothetical protein